MKIKFVILFFYFSTIFISSEEYLNQQLGIKFSMPIEIPNYNISVKDHTDFLISENLFEKYTKNFKNNNNLEVVPFLPADFIENKIIDQIVVKITKSKGADVMDGIVGREITFINKNRYITIYISKFLKLPEGTITGKMMNEINLQKEKEQNDKKLLEMFDLIISSLKFI